ncbi:MAG: ribulose-phosphate 3-epimerase [Alistipes sp.]|nr:ribulose-phosphate 3-epimerase [Alistipes sp.]MBQ5394648.1 ribulose-phosphate 3-epimerase [Alistipes sp.]
MERIIAPSVLSADFGHLERDVKMVEQSAAAWIHVDVMDGLFVPNLSFGFPVLRAIRRAAAKPLDVHLMIVEPERYIARFAHEGADWITFHLEATQDALHCIHLIRESGAKVGVSVKPKTPIEALRPILKEVDMVLVMSVEPGFGGQKFIPESLDRIRALRRMAEELNPTLLIEVDGGISAENAGEVFDAGANVLVAGSSVFKAADPEAEIVKMLKA